MRATPLRSIRLAPILSLSLPLPLPLPLSLSYTLDAVHHTPTPRLLTEVRVVRPGSSLDDLRALAKVREHRTRAATEERRGGSGVRLGQPTLDPTGWAPLHWCNNQRRASASISGGAAHPASPLRPGVSRPRSPFG